MSQNIYNFPKMSSNIFKYPQMSPNFCKLVLDARISYLLVSGVGYNLVSIGTINAKNTFSLQKIPKKPGASRFFAKSLGFIIFITSLKKMF